MNKFELSPFSHAEASERPMVEKLQAWADIYAKASDGRMEVLAYQPGKYQGQDGLSVIGQPNAAAVVDSIAEVAQPRYYEVRDLLHANEAETKRVSMIGELLKGGDNVVLATNHGDLIDIAIAQAATYSTLEKLGYKIHDSNKKDDGYDIQTGIIISKMVAFLAYKLGDDFAPCTDVLKLLENETFLSYPRTESTKKHLMDRFLFNNIERHNQKMRDQVVNKLGKGSLLLAMAASGTTDKPLDSDPSNIAMGKIGTGTLKLLQQPGTYVAPMAVWYQGESPVMELTDIPRIIKTEQDAHTAMQTIATTLTTKIPTLTFTYAT